MTKMTQREYFNEIIKLAKENNRMDIVEFAQGRIEVLNNKSSSRKATKTQVENEGIKETILETLRAIGSGTVSEIQKANDELSVLSNQKVTALIRQLILSGAVSKDTSGKKSIFSIVEE